MVRSPLPFPKTLSLLILTGISMQPACSTKTQGPDLDDYRNALKRTADLEPMKAGSPTEHEALKRFEDFYAVYSAEAIRKGIRAVYAEDAWFGDPYHTVQGIDDIEHYFVTMAEPVQSCTFTIDGIHRSGKEYYAHWTMHLVSKAAGDEPITAIGLSHVRFNEDGKIVFQQDYWDTSAMLDRLPVVGFWTRLVKGKIMKGLEE